MHRFKLLCFLCLLCIPTLVFAKSGIDPDTDADVDIPYEKYVLDNGLTLILHEDHKAPIVAVNVWYHVGSKNEKPGKTGFAHLFEHLMFNGSEHFNDDYFQALERVGATDLNGTTNKDRTNYFQNVPTSALDLALWMESDRMGHLLGVVDQARLDEQRGVVQNEKRQGENQPYGRKVWHAIAKATYPSHHPYSWETIGSMEDLDAATLDDVHEWFKEYYGAANAVLVIAGDVDMETVKAKVEKYFGGIASGPPVSHHDVWIHERSGKQRQVMQDRVPQARIYKVWNIPQWGSEEADYLDLVSDVLAQGKTSRLYKRLVYDDQIATDVTAFVWLREIGGQFITYATAKPGGDLAEVERAMDEEIGRFLAEGPTETELQRVKTQHRSRFVRGIERIGGFGGKSDILAKNEVYAGNPESYKTKLERVREASAQDLLAAAQEWLSDGEFALEVHPFPEYMTIETDVDRSKLPDTGEPPEAKFPDLQRATLSNGLKIVLAERHAVPMVKFNLLVDAGYAADQFAIPGTANLAMDMMDEGTKTMNALEISEKLSMLGARLNTGSNLDMSFVNLSALKSKLDEALDLYAEIITRPSFPESDFERLQKQQLASIEQEKANPIQMALRVFPKLLYGEDHAYSLPFTGSGYEETVSKLSRDDLAEFHETWFKPNNATIVVVGATTMNEIKPKLEELFKDWKQGDVPDKNISKVEHRNKPVVYLMDKPDAVQSIILAGHVAPSKSHPDDIAMQTMNDILGGTFTSRINMNLREDKHWSYGSGSVLFGARGQRPFIAYGIVQTDKTKESMVELSKELKAIQSQEPPTEEELTKIQKNRTLRLPGSWETISEVGGSINEIVRYDLPDDYFDTYPEKIKSLAVSDVAEAGDTVIRPDNLIWVVVGDRDKIEDGIRQLGYGEIQLIDSDGNVIE
ncbi:insulinase family protein [candidate division KSB1 bacterium]|nr:insulinase family protein [candidate division KSB1 bacterium]NIR69929.1 insulinase family protein [candidate division KSB1 bacterium]NIS25838.1 insulinase family protein [candidate division KSB1 bacterium]NIT72713.1 insulinase family protein [candidate division KSB1 bacterium]NIU26527.1 insulinase family protein [candidate division KSB1 bacterium]